MTEILYIGNVLGEHGVNPTTVETLSVRLSEMVVVRTASRKLNKILRLYDMLLNVWIFRKSKLCIIDTYSSRGFWYAWMVALWCYVLGMPYVLYLHGGNLPLRVKSNPSQLGFILKNAKHVICPSGYLRDSMLQLTTREYKIIPNYVDIVNYPFRVRSLRNASRIKILWVRAFHNVYNPRLAVRVVHILKDKGYKVSLAMVGPDKDGSLQDCQEYAKKLKVDDCVDFKGYMSKNQWISLSKDYDFFLNTTNFDNTPVSIIEAMALGLIVISTKVGGIGYLFENKKQGLLVKPDSPMEIIEAIDSVVQSPMDGEKYSRNARTLAEQWDWNKVYKLWGDILK